MPNVYLTLPALSVLVEKYPATRYGHYDDQIVAPHLSRYSGDIVLLPRSKSLTLPDCSFSHIPRRLRACTACCNGKLDLGDNRSRSWNVLIAAAGVRDKTAFVDV